ncbi:MAG: sugar phosphate isomerase/epimerase family protein [Candidatus Hydrogenedentota bacterium]
MKYSFMSFSCPELTLEQMLDTAKRFGYDGIEPRIQANHAHGVEFDASDEERAEIRTTAQKAGIALCCVATSCRYADPETTEQHTEDTHTAIDLAADIGSPCIRVFGGLLPEGVSRDQGMDLVVNALASVADHAEERAVRVCMETHDDWCEPGHVAEVMRRVNRSAIAVNWDIMHPIRRAGATMEQAFKVLHPWIRHVHFHDGRMETEGGGLTPIGEGVVDHATAVRLLQQNGYDGFLSGEWIKWTPWEEHLPRELATMRDYENR